MKTPNGMHIYNGEQIITVGRRENTHQENMVLAYRKVRVGQVAQLPDGALWLRLNARKDPDGAAWVRCK